MATKRATLSDFAAKKPQAPALSTEARPPESAKGDKRKGQTLRLSEEAWLQLKQVALDERTRVHDILVEAVNDAFRKRGKPPIA